MTLKLNHKFEHETTFSKQLTENLKNAKLESGNQETTLNAEHNTKQGRNRKPDISLYPSQKLDLEWRNLSYPFYIECKLGREYRKNGKGYTSLKQIHDNLIQLLKYNYEENSHKVKDLEKYGDRHVAVTTPKLLKEKTNARDFKEDYVNLPQLIRTLWKLGLGIFYQDRNGNYKLAFNEQEVAYIHDF